MISKTIRKLTTLLLAAAMLITVFQGISVPVRAAGQSSAKAAFAALKQDYELYGVLTNDADIPVYKQADTGAAVIKTLPSGSQVTLTDAVWDTQTLWFKIGFAANGTAYSGYVESRYVATADARLAEWEEQYLPAYAVQSFGRGAAKNAAKVSSFPESYRPMLKKLLQAHPNWTFVPMNTGLEWADVLKAEMTDSRNLVQTYHPDTWKSTKPGDYNAQTGTWTIKSGTDWVQASEAIVKFYLDPRNFLTEESVFQFEQLVYGSHHTKAGVEKILSGTFMANKKLEDKSGGKITYSQAFMKIGKSLKVSPYFLASRVRQEQGSKGDSPLISGTYPGFEGYYNYFNRRASGVGEEVYRRGLEEAKAKALAHAGLKADQVSFTEAELDWDDGKQVYDIEFYTADFKEYDYEIDAKTGEVLEVDYDAESFTPPASSGTVITREKAQEIALAKVPGADASHIKKLKLDKDDGKQVYDVEIIYNGAEHEMEIDAVTGKILEYEMDRD